MRSQGPCPSRGAPRSGRTHRLIPRIWMGALGLLIAAAIITMGVTASAASPRYDQIMMTQPHNSMQKIMPPGDFFGALDIRSLEIDVHGKDGLPGDWEVYHVDTGTATHVKYLSDYLELFYAYHTTNPQHEVITIWLDGRGIFSPRRPGLPDYEDMDTLLLGTFGSDVIFSPEDLWARCPSTTKRFLQDAVDFNFGSSCTWPTLEELRGKFIFVLTGDVDDTLDYANTSTQRAHQFFDSIEGKMHIEDLAPFKDVVFFNYNGVPEQWLIEYLHYTFHSIVRSFDVNDEASFDNALASGVNIIGTDCHDELSPQSWCDTRVLDFPFLPLPGLSARTDNLSEVGKRKVAISRTVNGDTFAYYNNASQTAKIESQVNYERWADLYDTSWRTSNGHGCVIARSSASGGVFFAVCRPNGLPGGYPFENDTMRNYVWYSGAQPVPASWPGPTFYPDIKQNEFTYLKIELTPYNGTSGVTAKGYTCNGKGYRCDLIATANFANTTLPYRGVHVWGTPNAGPEVKFWFTNTTVGNIRMDASASVSNFGTPPGYLVWNSWASTTLTHTISAAHMNYHQYYYPDLDLEVPPGGLLFSDLHGNATDPDLYLNENTNPTISSKLAASTSTTASEFIEWRNETSMTRTYRVGGYQYSGSSDVAIQNTVQAYTIHGEGKSIAANAMGGHFCFIPRVGQTIRVASTSAADHALYLQYGVVPTTTNYYSSSDWIPWPTNTMDREVLNFVVPSDNTVCVAIKNKTASAISAYLFITGD